MPHETLLSAWESFYVIVGSSGAALIGLQFVVVTLIAEMRPRLATGSLGAFGTPTVVHFGGALMISAVMSAPWPSLAGPRAVLAICGIAGIIWSTSVMYRGRRQTEYAPVWDDWLWHVILPSIIYAMLALAALFLRAGTEVTLFMIAGAALGLLLIGIHNAWDTVTYIVTSRVDGETDANVKGSP